MFSSNITFQIYEKILLSARKNTFLNKKRLTVACQAFCVLYQRVLCTNFECTALAEYVAYEGIEYL